MQLGVFCTLRGQCPADAAVCSCLPHSTRQRTQPFRKGSRDCQHIKARIQPTRRSLQTGLELLMLLHQVESSVPLPTADQSNRNLAEIQETLATVNTATSLQLQRVDLLCAMPSIPHLVIKADNDTCPWHLLLQPLLYYFKP